MKVFEALRAKFKRGLEVSEVSPQKNGDNPLDLSPLSVAKATKNKPNKFKERWFKPINGKVWNPVRDYPVNKLCFCGSLVKAKRCCLPFLARTVSEGFARDMTEKWDEIIAGKYVLPKAPRNKRV